MQTPSTFHLSRVTERRLHAIPQPGEPGEPDVIPSCPQSTPRSLLPSGRCACSARRRSAPPSSGGAAACGSCFAAQAPSVCHAASGGPGPRPAHHGLIGCLLLRERGQGKRFPHLSRLAARCYCHRLIASVMIGWGHRANIKIALSRTICLRQQLARDSRFRI